MEASFQFELAVYASWIVGIGLLVWLIRARPRWWHRIQRVSFAQPRREIIIALLAAAVLIAISVSSDHLLLSWKHNPDWRPWVKLGQLVLVYSPIVFVLVRRRQGLDTCFLRGECLPGKIIIGLILSLIASFVFLLLRGRMWDYPAYLRTLGDGGPAAMLQTFLEGFGIAFVLYRFGAWIGIHTSAVVVAILFMAAHLPNYTSGTHHLPLPTALMMAGAHAGIAVVIFYGVWFSQDIVVLGFLHWFINAASDFTT